MKSFTNVEEFLDGIERHQFFGDIDTCISMFNESTEHDCYDRVSGEEKLAEFTEILIFKQLQKQGIAEEHFPINLEDAIFSLDFAISVVLNIVQEVIETTFPEVFCKEKEVPFMTLSSLASWGARKDEIHGKVRTVLIRVIDSGGLPMYATVVTALFLKVIAIYKECFLEQMERHSKLISRYLHDLDGKLAQGTAEKEAMDIAKIATEKAATDIEKIATVYTRFKFDDGRSVTNRLDTESTELRNMLRDMALHFKMSV